MELRSHIKNTKGNMLFQMWWNIFFKNQSHVKQLFLVTFFDVKICGLIFPAAVTPAAAMSGQFCSVRFIVNLEKIACNMFVAEFSAFDTYKVYNLYIFYIFPLFKLTEFSRPYSFTSKFRIPNLTEFHCPRPHFSLCKNLIGSF